MLFFALSASSSFADPNNNESKIYFQPGESHVYQLNWGLIPAGWAKLSILPSTEVNGRPAWHFSLSIRTCRYLDLFYKVRDRIDSFTDINLNNSYLYRKHQREGKTKRDVEVEFDQDKKTATYTNNGDKRQPIEIDDGTLDPLAALFFVRNQRFDSGKEINRPITDGKRKVIGNVKILKREKIFIGDDSYDTYVVEPDLRDVRGVFEKDKKSRIRLWITADDRRLLVKIKSKVVVGSFTGYLAPDESGIAMPDD